MKFSAAFLVFLVTINSPAQSPLSTAQHHLKLNETQQAKGILEKFLESNPGNSDAVSLLGDIAIFEHKWEVALSHYKSLLNSNPGVAEYHFKYGGALGLKALKVSKIQAMVFVPEIKKHLEKAAELDPTHIKSRRALIELYMKLPGILGGNVPRAQQLAEQLKAISPIEAAMSQALIYKAGGDMESALLHYKKAFAQSKVPHSKPENNYLNYELGKIAADNNIELSKGLTFLDFYVKNYHYRDVHPPEWAYYRKAQIQGHLQNKLEAQKLIEKALSIRKDFEEAAREKKKLNAL